MIRVEMTGLTLNILQELCCRSFNAANQELKKSFAPALDRLNLPRGNPSIIRAVDRVSFDFQAHELMSLTAGVTMGFTLTTWESGNDLLSEATREIAKACIRRLAPLAGDLISLVGALDGIDLG